MSKFLALFLTLSFSANSVFAAAPVVRGHEFVAEEERVIAPAPASTAATADEKTTPDELGERLAKDSEFIDDTGNLSFEHAIQALQHIYDNKAIYWETREEALRTLLLRFERSPGKKARSLQKYLIGKLRNKNEPLEAKKLIYDSIAGQANKAAIPAMVTVAADPAIHEVVRFEACKDLAAEKLKPGQKQIVRKALNQLATLKSVKSGEIDEVKLAEVQGLMRKF